MKKMIAILTFCALLTCCAFAEKPEPQAPEAAAVAAEETAEKANTDAEPTDAKPAEAETVKAEPAETKATEEEATEAAPAEAESSEVDAEEEAAEEASTEAEPAGEAPAEAAPADANAPAVDAPTEVFTGVWQDPAQDRAVLTILPAFEMDVPEDETWFDICLEWANDVKSQSVWYMSARYDAPTDSLKYTDGTMSQIAYGEDGNSAETKQWEDAEGTLTLNADGKLLWADSREEKAADFAFEKQSQPVPTPEELDREFVGPIAKMEKDTAGASLKLADTTCKVIQYAYSRSLWSVDPDALCENLTTAWKALDEEGQKRFDENLMLIMDAANEAFGNYDNVKSQYEDAGAGAMSALAENEEALLAWETLLDCSLMMEV